MKNKEILQIIMKYISKIEGKTTEVEFEDGKKYIMIPIDVNGDKFYGIVQEIAEECYELGKKELK